MASKTGSIIGSAIFFVIAPGVVAGWIPYTMSRWHMHAAILGFPPGRGLGIVLMVLGTAVLVDCFARFAFEGRGTPAPAAPTESLVVSGLYRHVRNPMYLGVVSAITGQGLLFGSVPVLQYAALVWVLFHLFIVIHEEPTLRARFGDSYRVYRQAVRRWWPHLKPWVPKPDIEGKSNDR